MSNRGSKIWEVTDGPKNERGWYFGYFGADDEWTEDGPYKTRHEATDRLYEELDDLFIELEGML